VRGILSLKPADRPERRNQQSQKEEEQRDHRGRRYVIPSPDQTDEVFGTHTGINADSRFRRCHCVAMIGLGEQRCFGEELAFGSCEKHQSPAMYRIIWTRPFMIANIP
jgi:hypothetical protein